jgi:hypothetical protein
MAAPENSSYNTILSQRPVGAEAVPDGHAQGDAVPVGHSPTQHQTQGPEAASSQGAAQGVAQEVALRASLGAAQGVTPRSALDQGWQHPWLLVFGFCGF